MRVRTYVGGAAVGLAALGTAGTVAATSASASPLPAPRACAYNFGPNVLQLTFQGTVFNYPVSLHTFPNGLITGFLRDNGLPVNHRVLQVTGVCRGDTALIGVNYPVGSVQGSRAEVFNVTPVIGHPRLGSVAGNWTEDGTEQGNGTADLAFDVIR